MEKYLCEDCGCVIECNSPSIDPVYILLDADYNDHTFCESCYGKRSEEECEGCGEYFLEGVLDEEGYCPTCAEGHTTHFTVEGAIEFLEQQSRYYDRRGCIEESEKYDAVIELLESIKE